MDKILYLLDIEENSLCILTSDTPSSQSDYVVIYVVLYEHIASTVTQKS